MTPLFDGKRALVTGGGTGIGRAAALALAAQGCFVTVAERTEMTLQQTVELIEGAGGSAQLTAVIGIPGVTPGRRPPGQSPGPPTTSRPR